MPRRISPAGLVWIGCHDPSSDCRRGWSWIARDHPSPKPQLLAHEAQHCRPEDFQVEELSSVRPSPHGRYTFYRLTKRGLGTIEAVEAICRRWNLSSHRISYGGLKDPTAATIQYLTIQEGPEPCASGVELRA